MGHGTRGGRTPLRRRRFLAATSAAGVGIAVPSCSASSGAYAIAAEQTWRPFDASLERLAPVSELVRYATLAPSSHNTQCWRFGLDGNVVSIRPDASRRCPAVDPDDHHLFVSLGCATENLVQAALASGLRSDVHVDPASGEIRAELHAAKPVISELFRAIPMRQSTRTQYDGRAVPPADLALLEAAGHGDGVHVVLLTERRRIEDVLQYVIDGNTAQINDPLFLDELLRWIRFSDAEAIAKRDGLFSRASGNPVVPRWVGSALFRLLFTARGENDKYARFMRSSAGIAIFVSDANDRRHWVEAGRCYERFALQATALGIRTAMVNQAVEVKAVRAAFARSLGITRGRPDLIVRFGYGPEMPRSLRRPIGTVITKNGISFSNRVRIHAS